MHEQGEVWAEEAQERTAGRGRWHAGREGEARAEGGQPRRRERGTRRRERGAAEQEGGDAQERMAATTHQRKWVSLLPLKWISNVSSGTLPAAQWLLQGDKVLRFVFELLYHDDSSPSTATPMLIPSFFLSAPVLTQGSKTRLSSEALLSPAQNSRIVKEKYHGWG